MRAKRNSNGNFPSEIVYIYFCIRNDLTCCTFALARTHNQEFVTANKCSSETQTQTQKHTHWLNYFTVQNMLNTFVLHLQAKQAHQNASKIVAR